VADTGPEEEGRWIMLNPCGMNSAGQSKSRFVLVPFVSQEIRLVLIKAFSRRKVGVMGGCFDDVFLFGPDDM
jgi:hypothetical protein